MKKKIALMLATLIFTAGFAACKDSSGDGSEHIVTLYRYTTLGLDEGTEDEVVERAIADKF